MKFKLIVCFCLVTSCSLIYTVGEWPLFIGAIDLKNAKLASYIYPTLTKKDQAKADKAFQNNNLERTTVGGFNFPAEVKTADDKALYIAAKKQDDVKLSGGTIKGSGLLQDSIGKLDKNSKGFQAFKASTTGLAGA